MNPLAQSDWRKVRDQIDARIADHQRKLENPTLGEVPTAVLRGRIAELRKLIEWGEPAQNVQPLTTTVSGY